MKKASKLNQKVHRERHQPEARKSLGLLEKHKDYKQRSTNYNEKQATLKLLHKRALNKNPDEFYYHMINSKANDGIHHERKVENEDTPEQLQLMHSQDLKYISLKRVQEFNKIDRLQAQLHLTNVSNKVQNKHVYFSKHHSSEEPQNAILQKEYLSNTELPDIDIESLKQATKKRTNMYMELAKRVKRERELSLIQQKLEVQKQLENKKNILKPKRIRKGSKDAAPVYKWKYERKR